MRKLFAGLLLLIALPVLAQDKATPSFADIPWTATADQVVRQLEAKGFTASRDKDGDIEFKGTILSNKAIGLVYLSPRGLPVKMAVRLVTRDEEALTAYRIMAQALRDKYGAPTRDIEQYGSPYYKGDGYETQAIRMDKALVAMAWGDSLMLRIHRSLTVETIYESPAWIAESARRRGRETAVF